MQFGDVREGGKKGRVREGGKEGEGEGEGGRERGTYEDVDETGDMSMLEGFQDVDLGLQILEQLARQATPANSLDRHFPSRFLPHPIPFTVKSHARNKDGAEDKGGQSAPGDIPCIRSRNYLSRDRLQ